MVEDIVNVKISMCGIENILYVYNILHVSLYV
jgi:hypothetical protein